MHLEWATSLQTIARTMGRGAILNRMLSAFGRMSGLDTETRKATSQRLYRVREASGTKDDWERRIIGLSNGYPVGEIVETLYREEIKGGAWVVDVGLWKGIFDQSVHKKINELVSRGFIRLNSEDGV